MSTYGTRLRQERLRLRLTQKLLAQAGGISPHAQSCYERDITLPRAPYLAAITSQGVDVLYVITGRYTAHRPQEEITSFGNGQLIEQ